MEMVKKLKSVNGETPLPEVMIQHIQSFLSGKEVARTTILSKAWYAAWSTRPTLDLDPNNFEGDPKSNENGFEEYAMKSLQRYQDSNLKLDSFRLRMDKYRHYIIEPIANELILKALKLGATDLNLEFSSNRSLLPREVLESETLVRLSVKCSGLKSLALDNVFRFMICRPKFLRIYWLSRNSGEENEIIRSNYWRFMKEKISPNRGIPNQVFWQIGLMEVSMEIYGGERGAPRLLNEGLDEELANPLFAGMFLFQLRWA